MLPKIEQRNLTRSGRTAATLTAIVAVCLGVSPVMSQPEIPANLLEQLEKAAGQRKPKELPKFEDIAKDYEKVISTADGQASLYTIWVRKKDGQMLAELPGSFQKQLLFIAYTISGGIPTAGVQFGDMYVQWKKYDKRLALIQPNLGVRTTGDLESKKGKERVFTDRVVLDVPIVAMGKKGGPVIDMDALLVGQASKFFGPRLMAGANRKLATIAKAKAFPKNVELAFELPLQRGRFGTLHYSISVIPHKTGYKPRAADARLPSR